MKIEDIKEVFQSSDVKEVNEKLKLGWKLYKIAPSKIKNSDYELTNQTYYMGRYE